MTVSDGFAVAGSAGRVRAVADGTRKRHRRFSGDGTWDRIYAEILADADAAGGVDWAVSVDSTVNRAHQHATNLPRDTGGSGELQESARGAA